MQGGKWCSFTKSHAFVKKGGNIWSIFFVTICDTLTLLHTCIESIGDKSCFSLSLSAVPPTLLMSRYENTVVSNAHLTHEK
jgi:hypothetical protein